MKTLRAAITAALLAIALSACGSADPTTAHTDADVAFAQGMIPHHTQALEMARLAPGRAGERVLALARRISDAQGPEIARMRGFLAAWGAPETGHDGMSGMLTEPEIGQLGRLSGPAFDTAFLTEMTRHHEGAVRMAQAEIAGGTDPSATALARSVVADQQAEITAMRGLLG